MIGAAYAGCFSMALANTLAGMGFVATSVKTTADVHLGKDDKGFLVTRIDLTCEADGPRRRRGHVPGAGGEDAHRLHHRPRPVRDPLDAQGDAEEVAPRIRGAG